MMKTKKETAKSLSTPEILYTAQAKVETPQRMPVGRPAADTDFRSRLGQVVKRYRLAAGLEQIGLAKLLGCSSNAIGGWELGRTAPSIDMIPRLCDVLHIPLYDLMGLEAPAPVLPENEKRILSRYFTLNDQNQGIVSGLMDQLIAEQDRLSLEQERIEIELLYRYHECIPEPELLSSAAGPGAPAPDYVETVPRYLRTSSPARKSDLLMRVNGDSMGDAYPDGCRVFVNTKEETPIGEVGVFIVNGEYFIKERREDCLYSRNREHEDIYFHEDMDIRHVGHVIGVVDETDILDGNELDKVRNAFETMDGKE